MAWQMNCEYDFDLEKRRAIFPDVIIGDKVINRGIAIAGVSNSFSWKVTDELKSQVYDVLLPSTLRGNAPALDISNPIAGHYIYDKNGILFDAYLGVAQRLIDDNHPNLEKLLKKLQKYNLIFRRESSTNDFIYFSNNEDFISTPQDFGKLLCNEAYKAFPNKGEFNSFFSSSGSEAIEAAIKIACKHKHNFLRNKYGVDLEKKLMASLNIKAEVTTQSIRKPL